MKRRKKRIDAPPSVGLKAPRWWWRQDAVEILAIGLDIRRNAKLEAIETLEAAAMRALDAPEPWRRKAGRIIVRFMRTWEERPVPERMWGAIWRAAKVIAESPFGLQPYWPPYASQHPKLKGKPIPPNRISIRGMFRKRRKESVDAFLKHHADTTSLVSSLGADVPS